MDKRKITVKIQGIDYTIVSRESDEYMQRVGLLVDKKMHEITEMAPHLSTALAATLTAINLADDYYKAEQTLDGVRSQVTEYDSQVRANKQQLEEYKSEMDALTKEVNRLQIELAKKEAQLSTIAQSANYNNSILP